MTDIYGWPNVNWKFHDLLQEHIFEAGEDASALISVGSTCCS